MYNPRYNRVLAGTALALILALPLAGMAAKNDDQPTAAAAATPAATPAEPAAAQPATPARMSYKKIQRHRRRPRPT